MVDVKLRSVGQITTLYFLFCFPQLVGKLDARRNIALILVR